jgi:hypothetical protein
MEPKIMLQQVQEVSDATPAWANWAIMIGSVIAAWLAPLASFVAILWGALQIYTWYEKRKYTGQNRRKN